MDQDAYIVFTGNESYFMLHHTS